MNETKYYRNQVRSSGFGDIKSERVPIFLNSGALIGLLKVLVAHPFKLPLVVPEILGDVLVFRAGTMR